MVMSTLAVKPGRGLRARPAVPDPHRAGPRCSGFPNSFYAQDQQDECDCRYSGSAVVWPPEETASRGINISYRNVNGGMDTGAWPDQGQALRSKSTQAWAPALARRFRSGRLEGRRRRSPDSKAVGAGSRFSSGRCADRRARSSQPELKFRRHPPHGPRCQPQPHPPATVVASVGATGIAPIGANACASWDASAIISPTPAAANRTVFLMDCHLLLSIAARRETKRVRSGKAIGSRAAEVELSPSGLGRLRASHLGRRRPEGRARG